MAPRRLFVIAGELSGDALGGDLMAGLRAELPDLAIEGVGGPQMQAEGLRSLFAMSDLSVMGLVEILPRIPKLLARVRQTAAAILANPPDAIITIDSPDFCFRVVKKIKEKRPDIPVIHYVAPSVWAWRPERAAKMAKSVDHVLALLPFEPPLMEAEGMSCDFVGHPAAIAAQPDRAEVDQFKAQTFGGDRVLCVLPGSRIGEVRRMLPIFGDAVGQLARKHADLRVAIPVAPGVAAEVKSGVAHWPTPPILFTAQGQSAPELERRKKLIFQASHAALATSGTVALELAAQNCPMVVAYKANWATTRMVKKLAQIDTANLINIVTQSRIIPELLFEQATPENIVTALDQLLEDQAAQASQIEAAQATMNALGRDRSVIKRSAAQSVLAFLENRA